MTKLFFWLSRILRVFGHLCRILCKVALPLFCFTILCILFGLWFINYYFDCNSINQIIFHAIYLDSSHLSAYGWQIGLFLVIGMALTYAIYKKPLLWILVPLLGWLVLSPMKDLKVSNIKEDKDISPLKQILLSLQYTDIYQHLQTPSVRKIDKPKNLILIFAESMETTFVDPDFRENLIPLLSRLSAENTSFQGYESVNGTNWTIASHVSTLCGIPLRMQLRDKLGTASDHFLPHAVCLPDLLSEIGYKTVFVKGAYLEFVGTRRFVEEHHFNEIWGKDELIRSHYATSADIGMPEFGVNDAALFSFLRRRITALSQQSQPFFFAITTLDTHFPSGFVDPSCPVKYHDSRDAIKCSDKFIYNFVRWCQQQPFAKDTIIVVVGDHLMMNSSDISPLLEVQPKRETYNVVIFPQKQDPRRIYKPYSQMDWAATLLDLLGVSDSHQLGLGTSLLKEDKTWVEKLGPKAFEEELLKNSTQYSKLLGVHEK